MKHRLVLSLVLTAAAGAGLVAQNTAPPPQDPQQQAPPVFRSRIDTVTVDVTVTDRQGRPITDLKLEEFEIRESGKPQAIDTFKLIVADEASEDAVRTRQITSLADQTREAENLDNRLILIFLDDYHVRLGNSMRVREQLAEFVRQLSPRDLVAILTPTTPIAAATFSRHHDGTANAIMNFKGRKYDYQPMNEYERRLANAPPEYIEQLRNELAIRALASACVYLGTLREGRKALIYVSEGMTATVPPGVRTTGTSVMAPPMAGTDPASSQAFFRESDLLGRMRDIFGAAARSNTSIFTLDPRGLAPSEFSVADRVNPEADRQVLQTAMDSLRIIADQTDGRAILNRNDPTPELKKVIQEMSAYYLLAYTSTLAPRDGQFHPIQVRVKRQNVEVRARKGYWALTADEAKAITAPPKAGPTGEAARALELLAGVVEPTARRAVSYWFGAVRGGTANEKARATLVWEANAVTGVMPVEKVARLNLSITSGPGDVLFSGVAAPDPTLPRLAGRVVFDAPPGLVKVRVVMENEKGQRLDTEDLSFQVEDFTAAGPIISAPLLFRGRTAREMTQIRGNAEAVPVAGRQFSRTERLLLRFDAYGPGGTAPKVTLRLLNRNGEALATLPAPTATGATFEADVTLGQLPPGDYLLEITAAAGDANTTKLVGIRVTG